MASFFEYEYWRVKPGMEDRCEQMIRDWFAYVVEHHDTLFPEWKSTKYFKQTNRDGAETGIYIMLFEYHSLAAHHAYKERRKNWDGPYAEYKTMDPYQEGFDLETVVTEYWSPLETELWFEFEK